MRIGLRRTSRVCRETIRVFLLVAIRFRKGKIKRGGSCKRQMFRGLVGADFMSLRPDASSGKD
jgi:hypothetical protein